jgi:2'-5' RNA ligase
MTDDELEALLDELEAALLADTQSALDAVAQDFADELDDATELVAARFSVSRIRDMWRRRVGGIMDRLRSIAGRAADVAADDAGDELPDDWDENLDGYVTATRALLDAVGDRLASAATQSLAEGLNAGEDLDALKARLAALFADDGTQLGPGRAERIAMTEATRAFNAGTLAAAQALTGPDRPLVKQWITRRDARVRDAHADTNGQLQLLDDPFDVAGTPMQYPGDPTAPAALTVNCRCIMRTAVAEGNQDVDQDVTAAADEFQSKMPAQLKRYWLTGEGAAKIRWGTPGSFDRCVRALRDDFPENTEGLCANLHHEATGKWPGESNSAAAGEHTGAMVALMPTEEDAARLALDGGEAVDQLHLTLFYLGEAADWAPEQRGDLISRVAAAARYLTPVAGRVFGSAQWNPASDEPAWVWNVGDDLDTDGSRLQDAKYEITYALEDGHNDPQLPQQHSPWAPHVCAVYSSDDWSAALADKVGPVTFDRVRVAFAGTYTDIPLSGAAIGTLADVDYTEPEPVEYEEPPQLLTWSTPGATALAFENQQTGDGRVFAPGALYWSGGPWPLQYADEMNGGHDGARLAGAIFDMGRDGDRVAGAGVLYLTQQAGVEAAMLLSQGAPLGVSVDLDDVDVEMVDASGNGPQTATDGVYRARLVTASMLPLPDGGWRLTGETEATWTASVSGTVGETSRVDILVGPDGTVPADAFELEAAAGDPGNVGVVVDRQESGQYLMRITKARVRGATLVSIPAYADARIVLDDMSLFASTGDELSAGYTRSNAYDYDRVVRSVRKSLVPVTAADVARNLKLPVERVRRHLARAAQKGQIVRIARGTYVKPTEDAADVAAAATDGELSDELVAASAVAGDDVSEVEPDEAREEMEASAWSAMRDLPPMPAAWFAAPTADELPPGGPGVNYQDGRIFGWVAQAGEPHAGFAKKVTIDGLGRIDTSHFLRQRFTLDDGSTVKAGAFTMNVGHHRDGAECETSACQFDDTRTVAGIVTVGMSDRGMWFSGAAAPWMSEWDRSVFMATQPSYHMKKGPSGNWQLRAVLAVPVPGHSSPLLASAVVDRSNLALTAAATMAEVEDAVTAAEAADGVLSAADVPAAVALGQIDYDRLADSLVAAMGRAEQKKLAEQAELESLLAEGRKLVGDTGTVEGD